ncbi:TRAP transporter small permease [Caenispirillum bisanense]|uniref:TRAP transporter small permease n=1 Tax=Caenispirillum bisanense TaxID=414052 RepID=UPI0031DDF20A
MDGRSGPPEGGGRRHPALAAVTLLDRILAKVESFILAYGILAMFLNTISNVVSRYIFGQSLYFSEELNQFLIVLVTFVGLGYATRRGRHIRMSAFYDQLGDRARKGLMIVIAAVTGAVMFWLAWVSLEYVMSVATSRRVTPALQVPLYLTYVWVPFGFFLTGIQYALTVLRNLRDSDDVWLSWETIDTYEDIDDTMAQSGADRE